MNATTSTQPATLAEVVSDRTLRLLPIAADLLPPEIVDARRARKVRRLVLTGLLLFTLLIGAWYAAVRYQTATARESLAIAQSDAQRVLHQQRAFGEVVEVRAESREITTQLAELLATDLRWSRLVGAVQRAAPSGVALTGLSGTVTAGAEAARPSASAAAGQLPNTTGEQPVGTLTVSGTAGSKAAVAAYVDALAKIAGLGNPLVGGVTLEDGVLEFTVQLDITEGALGGRHASGGAGSGGN